jgi:hypothetical protein
MTAVSHSYDAYVNSAALCAGERELGFCVIAEEGGRFAACLGTHSLAVAPRLAEIAQASGALSGLLHAVRTQCAFSVPVPPETIKAVRGVRAHLQTATFALQGANETVQSSVDQLDVSTSALLDALSTPRHEVTPLTSVGSAEFLPVHLLRTAALDRDARARVGQMLLNAAHSILQSSMPFIEDCLSDARLAAGQDLEEAAHAFMGAAARFATAKARPRQRDEDEEIDVPDEWTHAE